MIPKARTSEGKFGKILSIFLKSQIDITRDVEVEAVFFNLLHRSNMNILAELCRLVNAELLIVVNMESVGHIAFHNHFGSGLPDSPLYGTEYRCDPNLTWHHLMNSCKSLEHLIA